MVLHMIVRGARVLDASARAAEACDILISDGAIAAMGAPGMAAPDDATVFDADRTLIHPGLVNSHTHGIGNFMKGRADRWTLELLLNGAGELFGNRDGDEGLHDLL